MIFFYLKGGREPKDISNDSEGWVVQRRPKKDINIYAESLIAKFWRLFNDERKPFYEKTSGRGRL